MFNMVNGLRVLVIGAHPDDWEIGAGGFVYRLIREMSAVVKIVILTPGLRGLASKRFTASTRVGEAERAALKLGVAKEDVEVLKFEDCALHLHLHAVIRALEERFADKYDIVLTHAGGDTHSDHCNAYQATLTAARYHSGTLMLYQGVSSIPNEFRPTCFVALDEDAMIAKQSAMDCHSSQRGKDFMQPHRTLEVAAGWAGFLRQPGARLEAFEMHKSFWWTPSSQTS